MSDTLKLKKVTAYTVYSSDDETRGSNKGAYKDYNIASVRTKGAGWYNSNGEVKSIEMWQSEETGELYSVTHFGRFTDELEAFKSLTIESIKSKLTKEEIQLLGI